MKKCDTRIAWPSVSCRTGKTRQMCLNLEAGAQPHQAVYNDAVRWQQAARDHAHSVVFKRADLDLLGNDSAIVPYDHQRLAGLVVQKVQFAGAAPSLLTIQTDLNSGLCLRGLADARMPVRNVICLAHIEVEVDGIE